MRISFCQTYEMSDGLSPQHTWFTSDTHFYHTNVISYCKRPFSSVDEMNETLIKRWNAVVQKNDAVFHLGDFCMGRTELWNHILDSLKGRIYLVLGNHDAEHLNPQLATRFEGIAAQMLLNINGQRIYLNHFPFLSYNGDKHGTWQFFGHIHSHQHESNIASPQQMKLLQSGQYDVGVDNNHFTPISFGQIQDFIIKQQLLNSQK